MKNLIFVIGINLFLVSCSNQTQEQHNNIREVTTNQVAEPFALVELFTSEGCYDCPPAEELLNKITKNALSDKSYVYPLAFHVDYWNKLGWKDVFADTAYSNRQRKYKNAFGNEVVYTPQMIINGEFEFVGSYEKTADSAISEYLKKIPPLYFSIQPNEDWTEIEYDIIKKDSALNFNDYSLCFAIVERGLKSEILRGENKGKTLIHENVVMQFTTSEITELKNKVKLPKYKNQLSKNNSLIAFIQHKKTMKIAGANLWNF